MTKLKQVVDPKKVVPDALAYIGLDTPFIEFYNILKETACEESLEWLRPFIGKTMGEAIDELPANSRESWAVWTLREYCEVLDAGARRHLIAHIKDPMSAFIAYLRIPELSDADDAILESKFKGKVPRAERELQSKRVSRRKAVNDVRHSL